MQPDDKHILLEQYKMFVEMADRVSERRLKTNQFYIGVISGLLGVLAFILQSKSIELLTEHKDSSIMVIASLGLTLNLIWYMNIRSFRKLNSGKFMVIHEMEAFLPFQPYDREWDIIKRGQKKHNYFQLSRVEQYLPIVLSLPFLILFFLTML